MMNRTVFFAFLLWSTSLLAQNSGTVINDPNAEPRSVSGFHTIMVEDGIDVYLVQGNEESVVVSANKPEYRVKVATKVVDSVLKIYVSEEGLVVSWRDRKLRAYVSAKNLAAIKAYGGSDIIIKGSLKADKLQIQTSGGSDLVGAVEVSNELNIEANSGSDITLSGTVNNLSLKIYSGSDFMGDDLLANYAIIQAFSGSDVSITVNKEVYMEATGGSDIVYKGRPEIKYSKASGGGSITRKD